MEVTKNRLLRRQQRGQRLRLTNDDRRRSAVRVYWLCRQVLRQVTTIVRPDKLIQWPRHLITRKGTYAEARARRRAVLAEIRHLVVQIGQKSPGWGYTRIVGR